MRLASAHGHGIKWRRVTVAPVLSVAMMAAMMAGTTVALAGAP